MTVNPGTEGRTAVATPRPSMVRGLIKACRPKQWAKNSLLFVAPAAAGELLTRYHGGRTLIGVVAFCLVSSATYLVNDSLDVESDRRHPTKRNRPIAAGIVPVPVALGSAVVLFLAGMALATMLGARMAIVVGSYVVLTTLYSFVFKTIPVVDMVALSSGFILRLLGGAFAGDVEVSDWFLIIACFGSLFIASAKRFAEKRELGEDSGSIRATLAVYSLEYLGFVRAVSVGVVLVAYTQFAIERGQDVSAATPWIQMSIIPFVIAILRYALLVDQGKGSAPEEVVMEDRQLQVMGALWVGLLMVAVYADRIFTF